MSGRRQHVGCGAITRALDANEAIQLLMVREAELLSPDARDVLARCEAGGVAVRVAGPREMKRMTAGEASEIVALTGPRPDADLASVLAGGGAVWLLSGIAYPGNAGFAIRTAEVSGAAAIVLDASFDRDGRRQALRASMRADRVFPVLWEGTSAVLDAAASAGFRVIAIEDTGSRAPWDVDLAADSIFVVGGEAGGIPAATLARCDETVRIPMAGFIPSYNLQAAVAVVAGERLRQLAGAV